MSGILFQLIPLFSTFGIIFTIDSPFILFWVVSMYLFLIALEKQRFYWLLVGVFVGLGLLTKYTMIFFYLCVFVYLLRKEKNSGFLSHNNTEKIQIQSFKIKNNFKNPMLYLSIIFSFIVFSPVIIWNFQHDWVTLKHTAGQAHIYDGFKISLKYFFEFIGSQLLVVTPLIFILGLYFIFKSSALNLQPSQKWFLMAFSIPVFAFFLIKSIHGKVQANWAMPAYIPFLILIAYGLTEKVYKKLIISAITVAFVFTFINHVLPYLNLPQNVDPSSRLKGWKELGEKVSEIKKDLEKEGKVIIFSDRYQISSELAFYTKDKPTVYCINLGRRMNQYDLWQSINNELNSLKAVHGVYVVYGWKDSPEDDVSSAFEKCVAKYFTVYKKGVKIRDYTIFKCYNFKGMKLRPAKRY
ncbi:MAG: glycosyltransferase family 39 protein [Thermodesulfovibrio sp.]